MNRVAVFVDAGYLFAQGSVCLLGKNEARKNLVLRPIEAVNSIKRFAKTCAPECSLLRIYWYDGAEGARPTTDQATLAHLNDVKLRLGFINSSGQQKGVDSLIVTDLIELARLKSITDAVLLSGDEDVRIGVQIAQNYGVRVHLLGIHPSRGSQSQQLLQEADTTLELNKDDIAVFLARAATSIPEIVQSSSPNVTEIVDQVTLTSTVENFVGTLELSELQGIVTFWQSNRGVPSDIDKKLLLKCGDLFGRKLERSEIQFMRKHFRDGVEKRLSITNLKPA